MMGTKNSQANSAIIGIFILLMTVFVLSALYYGQEIIIPLTLAILLTFLLSPIVTKMEKWIGRIPSILLIVIVLFMGASVIGYVLSREFVDLTTKLPGYQGNIQAKLQSFNLPVQGSFPKIWQEIQQSIASVLPQTLINTASITTHITQIAQSIISSLIHLLGSMTLVLLLVIFMLINREDLKGRIIRLIGQGHIHATTLGIDDIEKRVSHYLYSQLIINCSFGVVLATGLGYIGIPNAMLWGGLVAVLRFIPYIGTWISAIIPISLSFIVTTSWLTPLYTFGLFAVLDLICGQFVEPLLYGSSTGISPTALIIAAVFWTLLWGPVGLLLAIPLTVCLVVIGRHVPQLKFLDILLSDERPLEIHEEYYHRLLRADPHEGVALIEKYLKDRPLLAVYDSVFIPVIARIEQDLRSDKLDPDKADLLYQCLRDVIEDLGSSATALPESAEEKNKASSNANCLIHCLSSPSSCDEIASEMLRQVLQKQSFNVKTMTVGRYDDISQLITDDKANVICICGIAPFSIIHCRSLYKKLRAHRHDKVLMGLFGLQNINKDTSDQLRLIEADVVVGSLEDAVKQVENICISN